MFVVLNAIHQAVTAGDMGEVELSQEVAVELAGVFEELHTLVTVPFFSRLNQEGVPSFWDEWLETTLPFVDAVADRLSMNFRVSSGLRDLSRRVSRDGSGETATWLEGVAQGAGDKYNGALKVVAKADVIFIASLLKLVPKNGLSSDLLRIRLRSTTKAAVTYLLLEACRSHVNADRALVDFLLERFSTSASASLMNAFRLVEWTSDGQGSETLEREVP